MKRQVPEMTTDEEAEAFLDQDLSDLDFGQFKPVKFEVRKEGAKSLAPGTPAPQSGVYREIGPRNGKAGGSITMTRGKPLPPTQGGGRWAFVSAAQSDSDD